MGNSKDPKIAEMFQARVGERFLALCVLDSDVGTLANSLKETLLPAAEEVLSRQEVDSTLSQKEVWDLCDQRRQLKQQKYTSTEAGPEYRKVSRDVRKTMSAAREEWIEDQCKNIEKGMM